MSLIDLIQTNQEAAKEAIAAAMQNKVFDYLDNYKLDEEVVKGSVKKDKHGHILSMKTVPDKDKTASHGVTQGSVKKDSKGNVLSFKTEDFDAMTREEFDSINEEQLDELSKDTLKAYVKKAHKSAADNMGLAMVNAVHGDKDDAKTYIKASGKRTGNINKAVDKLAK